MTAGAQRLKAECLESRTGPATHLRAFRQALTHTRLRCGRPPDSDCSSHRGGGTRRVWHGSRARKRRQSDQPGSATRVRVGAARTCGPPSGVFGWLAEAKCWELNAGGLPPLPAKDGRGMVSGYDGCLVAVPPRTHHRLARARAVKSSLVVLNAHFLESGQCRRLWDGMPWPSMSCVDARYRPRSPECIIAIDEPTPLERTASPSPESRRSTTGRL